MEKRKFSIIHAGRNYNVSAMFRHRGGELLILLHGLGCSQASFRDIWLYDDLKDYSIISMDLLGFGESSKPDKFSYRIEDHALVCAEVVKGIPFKQIHIVAHSMGAAVGLLLPPELLNTALSFANLEGNLINDDCGIISRKAMSVPFKKFENQLLPDFSVQARSLGEGRFFIDSSLPLGLYKSAKSLVHWSDSGELFSRFKNLNCRKAYFYGQRNSTSAVLGRLHSIETIMIGRSGHFMMNDNPDEFYLHLRNFLGSV